MGRDRGAGQMSKHQRKGNTDELKEALGQLQS